MSRKSTGLICAFLVTVISAAAAFACPPSYSGFDCYDANLTHDVCQTGGGLIDCEGSDDPDNFYAVTVQPSGYPAVWGDIAGDEFCCDSGDIGTTMYPIRIDAKDDDDDVYLVVSNTYWEEGALVYGRGGIDTIHGSDYTGSPADTLNGGADEDIIYGNKGDDTINGGSASDDIEGGEGADTINGDGGPDTIAGDDGNDVIDGGDGADTIDGGIGDDCACEGTDGSVGSVDGGGGGYDYCYTSNLQGDTRTDCDDGATNHPPTLCGC